MTYNGEAENPMTVRQAFIEYLGRSQFDKLPKFWKDRVRAWDSLRPKRRRRKASSAAE